MITSSLSNRFPDRRARSRKRLFPNRPLSVPAPKRNRDNVPPLLLLRLKHSKFRQGQRFRNSKPNAKSKSSATKAIRYHPPRRLYGFLQFGLPHCQLGCIRTDGLGSQKPKDRAFEQVRAGSAGKGSNGHQRRLYAYRLRPRPSGSGWRHEMVRQGDARIVLPQ